jgi:hypothetical protein
MEELLGEFIVRDGNGEKLIRAPTNVYGKFKLVMHDDGSFTYRPSDSQLPTSATRYVVKDPKNIIDPISFKDQKKAIGWKERMERESGRVFRMEKNFPASGIKKLE